MRGTLTLEKAGFPTVAVVSTPGFTVSAKKTAVQFGMPNIPIVDYPWPGHIGGLSEDKVRELTDKIINGVIDGLTRPPAEGEKVAEKLPENIKVAAESYEKALEKMNQLFLNRHWSDGLPIIPPTEERIEWMLKGTDLQSDHEVAILEPRKGIATVKAIAINAVMAGCRPEYMPVLVAAVQAIADPAFGLKGPLTTTNAVSPIFVVNGPIRRQLNINSGIGCLGHGWRANYTIARAMKLITINLAGTWPGENQMAGFGKWNFYCVAEYEEENPWEPLHVELGYDRETNTVSVFPVTDLHIATTSEHEVKDPKAAMGEYATEGPEALLRALADNMAETGPLGSQAIFWGDVLWLLATNHVEVLAKAGYSKAQIKHFLYENSKVPFYKWKRGTYEFKEEDAVKAGINVSDPHFPCPVIGKPEDIYILVAGGLGDVHSAYFPTWAGFLSRRVTKEIKMPANWNEILERGQKEREE